MRSRSDIGLDIDAITRYIVETLPGVDVEVASKENGAPEMAWGDSFFFYDPDRRLVGAKRFPFATIVIKDYGDFDNKSNLNRPGVFRLNVGVGKATYQSLFGSGGSHDFAALDTLIPHPVYGEYHWVSVLNPSERTFEVVKPLLAEAHAIAVERYQRSAPI